MNINAIISKIYPEINQLEMFPHPKTGLTYSMLSESQLVELANKTLEVLFGIGIQQVIVSESGAVPFARICAWLGMKKNLPLKWYSIKVPRNVQDTVRVTLQTYMSLSIDELRLSLEKPNEFSFTKLPTSIRLPEDYFDLQDKSLSEILDTIQEEIDCSEHSDLLKLTNATGLAQVLEKPFIFFDEYIDSGKTLFQSFRLFQLFGKNLKFKIFSYLTKLPKSKLNQNICSSLYTLDNEEQAYQWGVYPFENRMDWLGYYYMVSPEIFSKISVAKLCNSIDFLSPPPEYNQSTEFLDTLKILSQDELLNDVKNHCLVNEVAQFITQAHLIQYSIYTLEKMRFGTSALSEFLYQLFDLYGPIWSPLPDYYHLSYLEAFGKVNQKMIQIFSSDSLKKKYSQCRIHIIPKIAQLFEMRRINQQQSLLNTLEKHYES